MFLDYGIDPSGELVHISSVQRGKTALVCPYCAGQLVAKKGRVKAPHFAHANATCRPVDRGDDVIALPLFDRFHLELSGKEFDALRRWHDHGYYTGRETEHLKGLGLIEYNSYKREDQLTKRGRIPFGELPLQAFSLEQDLLIEAKHREIMWSTIQAKTEADRTIATTDLRLFRAQWQRVLSLYLYFLQIDHPTGTFYKIGVTHRTIEERIAEIQRELRPHVGAMEIKLLRIFAHRGSVELYFKHRYHTQQHPIGPYTEYFQFEAKTRKNVLSDLSRMGHKEPGLIEQSILIGTEPIDPFIEAKLAEQHAREAERQARAERQAYWEQRQAEWRTARATIEQEVTESQPPAAPDEPSQDSVTPLNTKRLQVTDPRRSAYSRVIKTQPVTLTCRECGQTMTEEHFPGATPKYCATCTPVVKRRQTAARVRRLREKQRPVTD